MPRFSARTIEIMRRNVSALLTDTCSIISITSIVTDSAGHWTEGTTTTSNVPCRVLPLDRQTQDSLIADQEVGRTYYRLILRYDQAIASGAKVVIGGVEYEVKQLLKTDHTDKTDKQVIIVRVS